MITPTIRFQPNSRLIGIRVITRAFLGTLSRWRYAAFFAALTFAHRARCAAAILFLPAADMVCLPRFDPIETTFPALTFAHRAFCARLIRLRAEADMMRLRPASWLTPYDANYS
jgi:hypothetical protein